MREEIKLWHNDVLAEYNRRMFETLLYPEHVITSSMKEFVFKEPQGQPLAEIKGYLAVKDKVKYFVHWKHISHMPLRLQSDVLEEWRHGAESQQDVVFGIVKPIPFKVVSQDSIPFRQLIDQFVPFEHTTTPHWSLLKIISIMSYVGKTFVCVSSNPAFGKTSVFSVIHALTNKSPVFKPRSVPGVLNKITSTGNMVFDEAHESEKKVRDIMEEFSLDIAGGKPVYINGALKSHNTKNNYDCSNQSITYLYNNVDCYKQPDKSYFEVIFKNNKAIDDRFLKLKLQGRLTEKFSRGFDIVGVSQASEEFYRKFLKQLAWLREEMMNGKVQRKHTTPTNSQLQLNSRKKQSWDVITLGLDMYASSQQEYDELYMLLEQSVVDYNNMVRTLLEDANKDEPAVKMAFEEYVK